ncbi:MAG: hypothetical protein ACM3JB_21235 [Acidobacteriaceae bacterium]
MNVNQRWKIGIAAVFCLWVVVSLLLVQHFWWNNRNEVAFDSHNVSRESTSSRIGPFLKQIQGKAIYGQLVFLNDVRLEPGPKKNIFYVLGKNSVRLLVLAESSHWSPGKPDDLHDVTGSLQDPPATSYMRRNWGLSKAEAETVREQGVYLLANAIREGQRDQ